MRQTSVFRFVAAVMAICCIGLTPSAQPQVGLERKTQLQQDLDIPGYEVLLMQVTLAVGGREGRHTHNGTLVGHLLEGELTIEVEGQPTKVYKAGDSALIEPGKVHEAINTGSVPSKVIAMFVVEKGKPLSTPAK
jgi:quercetin dioxygenase-like cupin family protein